MLTIISLGILTEIIFLFFLNGKGHLPFQSNSTKNPKPPTYTTSSLLEHAPLTLGAYEISTDGTSIIFTGKIDKIDTRRNTVFLTLSIKNVIEQQMSFVLMKNNQAKAQLVAQTVTLPNPNSDQTKSYTLDYHNLHALLDPFVGQIVYISLSDGESALVNSSELLKKQSNDFLGQYKNCNKSFIQAMINKTSLPTCSPLIYTTSVYVKSL